LAWRIEFDPRALKELEAQDRQVQRRLMTFLRDRVAPLADPRSLGEALHGPELGRFWKYRVGEWRLVCQIEDRQITILVLRVGHRREVYRRA
jgi:mRNA interferase RelE/StbE